MPVEKTGEDSNFMIWLRFSLLLVAVVTGPAVAWGVMTKTVENTINKVQQQEAEVAAVNKSLISIMVDLETTKARLQRTEGDLSSMRNDNANNQKLLMEISGKIEVLMERTDPKKIGGTTR